MSPATRDAGQADDLDVRLARRLARGFGAAAGAGRDPSGAANDDEAWQCPELGAALRDLHRAQHHPPDLAEPTAALAACFDDHPHVVRALLYQPQDLLEHLPDLLDTPNTSAAQRWRILAGCAEVLWDYLHSSSPRARSHAHLVGLAARTRFLTHSEPFRDPDHELWQEASHRTASELARVLGRETFAAFLRATREARDIWRTHLAAYQSQPLFDHAPAMAVEKEVEALAFATTFGRGPLILADRAPEPSGSNRSRHAIPPADRAAAEGVVETHLLPRFAVFRTWAAVVGMARASGRWLFPVALFGLVGAGALLAAAAVLCAVIGAGDGYLLAAALAAGTYALIGLGVLAFGRFWAMPLMLRLPAAAAVGLILLIALHPHWWQSLTLGWGLARVVLVLGGAAFGYLLIEARNHTSGNDGNRPAQRMCSAGRVVLRAAAVTATAATHAILVALIGMVVLAPAFSEDGHLLRPVWEPPNAGPAAAAAQPPREAPDGAPAEGTAPPPEPDPRAILIGATAWCLAAGVFSQILWDDQPITAPLAHRRWRSHT